MILKTHITTIRFLSGTFKGMTITEKNSFYRKPKIYRKAIGNFDYEVISCEPIQPTKS